MYVLFSRNQRFSVHKLRTVELKLLQVVNVNLVLVERLKHFFVKINQQLVLPVHLQRASKHLLLLLLVFVQRVG